MTRAFMSLLLVASTTLARADGDHLVRLQNSQVHYEMMMREVFAEVFRDQVVLNALIVESFQKECAVGLRPGKTRGSFDVFALELSSSLWDLELIKLFEAGELGRGLDGKLIPLAKNPHYQALKKRIPNSFRQVKARAMLRPLPSDPAGRLMVIWFDALEVVTAEEMNRVSAGVDDGTSYHYYARVPERGIRSGESYSPDEDLPKSLAAVCLRGAAALYAKGRGGSSRRYEPRSNRRKRHSSVDLFRPDSPGLSLPEAATRSGRGGCGRDRSRGRE